MANVLTRGIWYCDSLGIIAQGQTLVKGIMYYPAAVDGEFTLKWWDEGTKTTEVKGVTYTIATSTDQTVTSTGNFPNTWLDGNVVKCTRSTGVNNSLHGLIKTAGNNNAFVVHLTPFTDEASKVGNWVQYTTYNAFRGKASKAADTETSMWFPFGGDGFWFPNLALDDIDTSDVVIIYAG